VSFSADWADLLTWDVQFTTPSGKDGYGNEQWTTPVIIEAHVDSVVTIERRSDQEHTQAQTGQTGTIYFGCDAGVTPGPRSRITFPFGLEVDLTSVVKHYDDDGNEHHYEATWEEVT